MNKKVLIAMSGGVDSSVAAFLLKQQGYHCTGATMRLFDNEDIGIDRGKTCCSLEYVEDARNIAHSLDIPYHVFNFTDEFDSRVIGKFIEAYQHGETPNPCIDCNRYLKFEKLFQRAKLLGMEYASTGHYACIDFDKNSERFRLKKAVDESKDQSYVLYFMTQEHLAHTLFPLGGLRKTEIREIAAQQGFINARKRDSQDICFVPDGNYAGFIERRTGQGFESGDFIDMKGNVLGRHRGLARYTIGQRKGLGLALKQPMYVHSKDLAQGTVTLCTDEELYSKTLTANDFNWNVCSGGTDGIPGSPVRCKAKVRYKHTEAWAVAEPLADGTVHIEFDDGQRAIAKGQAVVLYDEDAVIGGGTIIN